MKSIAEYTIERDATIWAVVKWRKSNTGDGYVGEKISSHVMRKDARKEVYRLNGWKDMRLDFAYNWNKKLNCKAFTSIRLWNENKYQVGNVFEVWLGNTKKGVASLVSLKRMRIDQINDHIALLDTGYRADECKDMIKTMYKNKRINWSTQYLAYCLFIYEENNNDLFNNQKI